MSISRAQGLPYTTSEVPPAPASTSGRETSPPHRGEERRRMQASVSVEPLRERKSGPGPLRPHKTAADTAEGQALLYRSVKLIMQAPTLGEILVDQPSALPLVLDWFEKQDGQLADEDGRQSFVKDLGAVAAAYVGDPIVPHRVSSLIDWVFGPAVETRSSQWFEATLGALCALGPVLRLQVNAAIERCAAALPLQHLEQAGPYLPDDLRGFIGRIGPKLPPAHFGALVHGICQHLRQTRGRAGGHASDDVPKDLKAFYRLALPTILDGEKPSPGRDVQRWAEQLISTSSPREILDDPRCSMDTRLKLFSLVASVRGLNVRALLLQRRRDEMIAELRVAAQKPGGRDTAIRRITTELESAYNAHAQRCLARCRGRPGDSAERQRAKQFVEGELAWLRTLVDTTGDLREARSAIGRSLVRLQKELARHDSALPTAWPGAPLAPQRGQRAAERFRQVDSRYVNPD